ncbi:DUF4430 domain-containing protein [Paenibacillus bouchesdurhonensis]|uniref:DUF4430 domain-containing protein n=1 Tax=Paenibacillus bouchesdurhonensis TaxID=1870990 RepID=UPI000DA5EFFE|nr:DUF4430 domain-containing protein [Paenibacillus bouchesdurhonensis]
MNSWKKWMKRSLPVLMSFVLLLSLVNPQLAKAAGGAGDVRLQGMIKGTLDYYAKKYRDAGTTNKIESWWELVALWGAGVDLQDGHWRLPSWEKTAPNLAPTNYGTDHIRYIFGLLAMGQDPAHAWETDRNLWAELAAQQDPVTGAIGGVNKHMWAMLALDAGVKLGADVGQWDEDAEQKALEYLFECQYPDGGFGLSPTGTFGDTDITGMALLALGKYQGQSAVDSAIQRAKELLKQRQLDNGGFDSPGNWGSGDNSNSLSTTVSGLVAAGDDALSSDWMKNGYSVLDAYESFQLADGSFKWKAADTRTNGMSTEQALIALLDIQHGQSTWYRIANIQVTQPGVAAQLQVTGMDGEIYTPQTVTVATNGEEVTALDVMKQGLDTAVPSIDYTITGSGSFAYVTSIAGQAAGTFGGWDGWMYTVNGTMPDVGAGDYVIRSGDQVHFYYSRWASISAAASEISYGAANPAIVVKLVGDVFTPAAEQASHWLIDPGTTGLQVAGLSLFNNQQVSIAFTGQAAEGAISVQALAGALAGQSSSEAITVNVPAYAGPVKEEIISIPDSETYYEKGSYGDSLTEDKIILEFTKPELPQVISVTDSTYFEIEPNTDVISSGWNNRIQLPSKLSSTDTALIDEVNAVLASANEELTQIAIRVKVGGDERIEFNRHVTLKLNGQGSKHAGWIGSDGSFNRIPKYSDSSAKLDAVYAYADNHGDLVIRTTHFTEFIAYDLKTKDTPGQGGNPGNGGTSPGDGSGNPGNGGGTPGGGGAPGDGGNTDGGNITNPPVTRTVTLSVEKSTIGEDDILSPVTVTLQDRDTAFTALSRAAGARNISIDYIGSGATLYVQAIDGLGEFDKGPESGWMYSVNGVFPNYSAGLYTLQNGDVLRWRYTTNLGRDLKDEDAGGGAPLPGAPGAPGAGGAAGGEAGGALGQAAAATTEQQAASLARIKEAIARSSAWILSNRSFSKHDNFNDWDAIALARSGKSVPAEYYSVLESYVREKNGEFRLVTDYERMALAVVSIGKDSRNVAGFDFLEKIYNSTRMTNQGTNGLVFALLALDAANADIPSGALWTRDKLVAAVLQQQNSDGGFPISKESNGQSDIDMTAMALQALAKYQDRKEVKAATENALAWLSQQQLASGGFKAWGVETSESISQVIIALSSLNIPLDDKRFVKSSGDLLTALQAYMNKDGGFAHTAGGASDYMATHQGLMALGAYERMLLKQSALFDMSDNQAAASKPSPVVYGDEASISAWAKEAVGKATELGLMTGTGAATPQFEPKRGLTRGEFAVLVVKLAGEQPSGKDSGFKDVSQGSWYAGYVAAAKEKGLISGLSESSFGPNQPITRQELATILVRMQEQTLANAEDGAASTSNRVLKDREQVSDWAADYVEAAIQSGLMSGDGDYFHPQQQVTREMAAVVIVKMHEMINP